MATIEVSTGYQPRPLQLEVHRNLKRFNVLVCHRRFGKTVLCINELIDHALRDTQERPRYAYLAPLYKQAKQVAWDYLKEYTRPIPGMTANEAELRVDLPNGARVQLFGADNPDALRGIYLDGVVLDEYGQMRPNLWTEVLRPALSDRKGWAIFIGTPKGRNAFHDIYEFAQSDPSWFSAMYKASETNVVDPDELRLARLDMEDGEYDQEFECSFTAAITGAYYGKLMEQADQDGRIGEIPWEPTLPVHTGWDLGWGDSTAIWFVQQVGMMTNWIDYYESAGEPLSHYAKELGKKSYVYGDIILPHDARQHGLISGKTREQELRSLLEGKIRIAGMHSVDDGINAFRAMLPKSRFNKIKCAPGIESLRNYRRDWNEMMGVFKPTPRHDWASHGADAGRYVAVGLKERNDARPKPPRKANNNYSPHRWRG